METTETVQMALQKRMNGWPTAEEILQTMKAEAEEEKNKGAYESL